MFSVCIRDHIMIAHSLPAPVFGPAQKMHGATYVVDARFESDKLDENGIVLDIGLAHQILKDSLKPLNYQNLDELPDFKGVITTTEFLAHHIHKSVKKRAQQECGFKGVLEITLGESHVAWASFRE